MKKRIILIEIHKILAKATVVLIKNQRKSKQNIVTMSSYSASAFREICTVFLPNFYNISE
jgi:hypothetical protein